MMNESLIGKKIVCASTGKVFIGASHNGFTTNYAWNDKGEVFSDEGVLIEAKKQLKTESKISAYLSGKNIIVWKADQVLMKVTAMWTSRSGFCGKMIKVEAVDEFGVKWYGKAKEDGYIITMKKKVVH